MNHLQIHFKRRDRMAHRAGRAMRVVVRDGLWRRRGDPFCPVYRVEEHVPWERDADVLLQQADGGLQTLRIKLSYLRQFWMLVGSDPPARAP